MAKSKVLIVDDEEDVVAALQFRLAHGGLRGPRRLSRRRSFGSP